MRLAITGGGTGGHLMVAKALAEAAKELGVATIFIGSTAGQDMAYFSNSKLFENSYFLKTQGVVNKNFFGKIKALLMILKALFQAKKILKKNDIDAVYSVGGFSASAASFAAIGSHIPLFIHEQNAKIGRLNALLKERAVEFVSSYDPNSPLSEYPVRDIFFEKARVRTTIKTILFLGGSQGASAINSLALEVAPTLQKKGVQIIHQTGKLEYEKVLQHYKELNIEATVFSFSDNIVEYMQKADFAVSRSGAGSLWELSANGLVALFIPYPYAAGDHQYHNALFLKEQQLGWVERQNEQPAKKLLSLLDENLEEKSAKLISSTKQGAAKTMITRVIQHLKGGSC